jgi:hypothetical protein
MRSKRALTATLLLFVVASMAFLAFKETRAKVVSVRAADSSSAPRPGRRAVAYYFHATQRCATCRRIEAYSRETIAGKFASELARGELEWRTVNVQLPENRHFVEDYQLFTRSLVLVEFKDGRETGHKVLEKTWELVGDKTAFEKYVVTEVRAILGSS